MTYGKKGFLDFRQLYDLIFASTAENILTREGILFYCTQTLNSLQ
jgi:hypothetical protein